MWTTHDQLPPTASSGSRAHWSTRRRARAAAIVIAGIALVGCGSDDDTMSPSSTTVAEATTTTSQPPVAAEELANGDQKAPIEVAVDGGDAGVDVTFRRITLAPGGSTGEHCHHGQLIAVVQEGALTHYADLYPGGVRVYETGEALVEGPGYRHEGRNEGDVDTVLMVTYLTPEGEPLAETDLTRCDE